MMESLLSAAPWGAGVARALVCEARVDPLTHTPAGPPCSRASGAVTGAAAPTWAISMGMYFEKRSFWW